IFSGPRVRIGRSRDNDVTLPELESPRSSAYHAEARFEDGEGWVGDLEATNGTLLNGAPIARAQLNAGDRISFGDLDVIVGIGSGRARWFAARGAIAVIVAAAGS